RLPREKESPLHEHLYPYAHRARGFSRRLFVKLFDISLFFLAYCSKERRAELHHFHRKYLAHAFTSELFYFIFKPSSHGPIVSYWVFQSKYSETRHALWRGHYTHSSICQR